MLDFIVVELKWWLMNVVAQENVPLQLFDLEPKKGNSFVLVLLININSLTLFYV